MIKNRSPDASVGVLTRRREGGITNIHKLVNGPARLTQALGIKDTTLSGTLLNKPAQHQNLSGVVGNRIVERQVFGAGLSIYLEPPQKPVKAQDIIASPRIGIREAVDMPWRFYIKDNPFVSKHPKARHLGL